MSITKPRKPINVNINGIKFTESEVEQHQLDPITQMAVDEIKAGNTEGRLDTRVLEPELYTEEELEKSFAQEVKTEVPVEQVPKHIRGLKITHSFDVELAKKQAARALNKGYRDLSLVTKMPQFAFLGSYEEKTYTIKDGDKEITFKRSAAERPLPAAFSPFVYPLVCIVRNVNLRCPELKNNVKLAQLTNILNQGLLSCNFSDVLTVHYIMVKMISAFVALKVELHPELVLHASRVWDNEIFGERPEWLQDVSYVNPYI